MSTFSWSQPAFPVVNQSVQSSEAGSRTRSLFGRDVWFDYSASGRQVTPAGDWKMVDGYDALKQSIIRRIITNPGEWVTNPTYGIGARLYVKAKNTRANREELARKIKEQLASDDRIKSVDRVDLTTTTGGLQISIGVTPMGSENSLGVALELV